MRGFTKKKICYKQVLIVAGYSHSQAFAQQLASLPLGSFYTALPRFSARMGYTRSAFNFFFSFFLSLPLFFLIKKIFIGALEKQTQHTAVNFVTDPIKNEMH